MEGQIELEYYIAPNGKEPVKTWLRKLQRPSQAIIDMRLARIRSGNFGDCSSVGEGVYEFRIHYGPGYRIYYGIKGSKFVLLLCGGNKSTQRSDIVKAKEYWEDYLANQSKPRRKEKCVK